MWAPIKIEWQSLGMTKLSLTDLDERSREILRLVVDSYVESGEPVGSRTLARRLEHSLSPATVRIATMNQLEALKDIPEVTRRCRAWGLGWRLHWPAHSANFGDLLSPRSYGHWGATGTVLWIDPQSDLWAVILTTEPQEPQGTRLARLSNLLAAALSEVCRESGSDRLA
jgi:CubicO group peptidase (beta-lactamase class C family)